ncbi:MAG: alpha/beta hydrolase [Burkholderiales bacterium]|nr:alpha/beta hydrolase [Burkholderiales bacterium]
MPFVDTAQSRLYYEVYGKGPPLLALPPGGMDAGIAFWDKTAFHPVAAFADAFSVIVFDERHSGRSSGSVAAESPWDAYAADHLALLDHLGLARVHAFGCCIGCSHALKLAQCAPARVASLVLEQPVGRSPDNGELLAHAWHAWAARLAAQPDGPSPQALAAFAEAMWQGDFVLSVPREAVAACTLPMLVLPGVDAFHPTAVGDEIAALAPRAQRLRGWKDSPRAIADAVAAVREFLLRQAI